jgi:hypothetical protein
MHKRWGANFDEKPEADADVDADALKSWAATRRWVRPLTYGNRLLGAGGLLLGVVVVRWLLG